MSSEHFCMHVRAEFLADLLLIVNVVSAELLLLGLLLKESLLTLLLLCLVRRFEVGIVKLADVDLADLYQRAGGNYVCLQKDTDADPMLLHCWQDLQGGLPHNLAIAPTHH